MSDNFSENFKTGLWVGLGAALLVFCMPLGIYALYQSTKIEKSLRIGDLEEFESRKRKIKTAWLIALVFYVVMFILYGLGAFD